MCVEMARRTHKAIRKKSLPTVPGQPGSPRLDRWTSLLKLAFLFFIASTVIGYTLGKALSPKYDTPSAIAAHVLGHLDRSNAYGSDDLSGVELTGGSWSFEYLPGTDLVAAMKPVSGSLRFTCHCKIFFYDVGAGKMFGPVPNPSANCSGGVQRRGLEFRDTLGVLIGSLEGYSVKTAITESRTYWRGVVERSIWNRIRIFLTSSIAVVSGVALGFYWGYEENPHCEEGAFAKEISSPGFWDIDVGAQWISQHTWRLNTTIPL